MAEGNGAAPGGLLLWSDIDGASNTDRLVKGLIGERSFSVIAGPSGSGKTFLALDMAAHVASGSEWFGRHIMHCGILYVGAEGQSGLRKRIMALKRQAGFDGSVQFCLLPMPVDLVSDHRGADMIVHAIAFLRGIWGELPIMVVVDTLARCFGGGDESATRDMNVFVTRCDTIRNKGNAAVLVVHHFGKDETKGMRGSVALKAAADTVIEVTGYDGVRTAKIEKQKDGDVGEKFYFNLKPVEIGRDEEDQPIVSCLVEPANEAGAPKKMRARVSAAAAISFEALQLAIRQAGQVIPVNGAIDGVAEIVPHGAVGVESKVWRQYAYDMKITEGETDSAKRKAFARSTDELQARRMIRVWNEWAWVCSR